MAQIPNFTPKGQSPHIVVLGAGASRAALPEGDAHGRPIPLMADLIELLGLGSSIADAGFRNTADFESLYDEIAMNANAAGLKAEIEDKVQSYFAKLELPESPTLYDYLVLALKDTDYIATFNWDPFLAQAFLRNREAAKMPKILFLHGNVEVGICAVDRVKGFRGDKCRQCEAPLEASRLLYPVRQKNYNSDPFIQSEWNELEGALKRGYMLTIFGYSAPKTDIEAVGLMQRVWSANPTFELGQVAIVDIKSESELHAVWEQFLCRDHYSTHTDIWETRLFTYPRRTCEAFAMATLQNDPWRDNPFPKLQSLPRLHAWLAPLIIEEQNGLLTGDPCLHSEDFLEVPPEPKKIELDLVLPWLKVRGPDEIIPPFCAEVVMRDGARYSLHSVLQFDEGTRTICFRIWDLRMLSQTDVAALKEKLNVTKRKDLTPANSVHPKLDWANVHAHYEDVSYCVEWHDRTWPKESEKVTAAKEKPKKTKKARGNKPTSVKSHTTVLRTSERQ